jgi:hypothetical protein
MRKGSGEIKKLSDLFEKYKNTLKAPQGVVIDCLREVVEDTIGLPIAKQSVRYSVHTKTLSVSVSGPLKSEIKLRKREILTHMKGRLGDQGVPVEIL